MINQTDSDSLIEQLSNQKVSKRGKLKIYLGYAAGVGKTFSMLTDAHSRKRDGIDVVGGYIEPHQREETSKLVAGLEVLPSLKIQYNGIVLNEFDLDAALKRKPELILVDELAHTNAHGCRHKKRYQDVEELLKAGIDVYTTINVQHIESLNDLVQSITGVVVKERIPDSVFESADSCELIDIEPDDLIVRLNQGKIYKIDQAHRALNNFFTKDKLLALREIALRTTADQVNRASISSKEAMSGVSGGAGEHILVCLSSAPSNAKVIRQAARLSDAFHASFSALYVETSDYNDISDEDKGYLRENTRLAEQLGASIATLYGDDIPVQIAEYANQSHVSKLVIGRSSSKRRFFKKYNFVDQLTEIAPNIDIYVIPDKQSSFTFKRPWYNTKEKFSVQDSLRTLAIILVCTLIGIWFDNLGFSESNIITVYILGVLINSVVTTGRMYSIIASVINIFVFNFFFTDPRYSFQTYNPGYPITFIVTFLAAFITSSLTNQMIDLAKLAAQRASRTEILLETSRKLQLAKDKTDVILMSANQFLKLLDRSVIFYCVENEELVAPLVFMKDGSEHGTEIYTTNDELAVAQWVYKNNKRAGHGTNTLSGAKCLYMAVRSQNSVFGVVGIVMDGEQELDTYEKNIMIAMLGDMALALEREKLNEVQKTISIKIEQEQLRANLLRAISHDLRTPLTSISGNAGILMGNQSILSEEQKKNLYIDIYDDSIWLINLVENLLSITRIEDGNMNLHLEPELLEEVIGESLYHINRDSKYYHITTELEDDLLMAMMDSRLIIQVIINIIDNAMKYTKHGSEIKISAKSKGENVIIEISDTGDGIENVAKEKIFDMFYTANNVNGDGRRGLGLGLALCKSIISAHGGTIGVRDNLPHGSIFYFTLRKHSVNICD